MVPGAREPSVFREVSGGSSDSDGLDSTPEDGRGWTTCFATGGLASGPQYDSRAAEQARGADEMSVREFVDSLMWASFFSVTGVKLHCSRG